MYARQEKNFMKDPLTAPARIYVGNLDQSVVEDDLRGLFSSYGKILGISVQRNFGFIQFDSEQSAQLAIQKELGNIFKGKKLNVRGAITGEGGKGNNNLKNIQTTTTTTTSALLDNNIEQQQHDEQQQQQTNVKTEQQQQQSINNTITNQLYPRRGGPGLGPSGRNNNNYRDRSPLDHHHQQQQQQPQQPRNYQQQRYSFNNNRQQQQQQQQQQQHGGSGVNVNKKIDCNDCEIIVVAKSLTEYAEYIENKLKLHGLTVDLLFPNEDVPIGRVLANIASRGCLYAILVTPQNEQYHSLTLNILYGATEEHRNMPTDDAINLIHKNFECYLHNGGNIINNNTNNNILNKLLIKHSDTIQILLNLLTENRLLSCIQYDILIKYLQERKQLQQQYEQQQQQQQQQTNITTNDNNINNNDNNTDNVEANELQTRILNILNKTTTTNNDDNNTTTIVNDKTTVLNDIVTSVISKINNKTTTNTTNTNTPPLLNDPSVQKALDSLLQADLLKNITIQQQQQHTNDINNESNNNDNNEHYGINYSSNIRRF